MFAIPGSIHNPMARGCHALIRQGAKLVETVDDILVEIGPLLGTRRAKLMPTAPQTLEVGGDEMEPALLRAMGDDAVAIDTLAERVQMSVPALQAALTRLELAGAIAAAPGGRYQRLGRAPQT